ncbi:MAG: UvrD-helicase domain-containing protein, partial [Chlamydiales bacterium]|nr:UvrD-helicase domain-containing protein [Chlamydiales bacterium]
QDNPEEFSKFFKGNYSSKEGKLKDKVTNSSNAFYQTLTLPIESQLEQVLTFLELHDPEKLLKKHHDYILEKGKDYIEFHKKLVPLIKEILSPEITYLRLLKLVLDTWKEQAKVENLFSPDELLNSTKRALSEQSFTNFLSKKYKAVCIDEFQDTDPIQWEIFSTLFPPHSHQLYLVGDPKQSIYAFRQADLYTFIEAGNKLGEGAKALLNTNYRSTPYLTEALNTFFCDDFTHKLFKLPVQNSHIPYYKVSSPERSTEKTSAPMKLWIFSPSEGEESKVSIGNIESSLLFPRLVNEIHSLSLKKGVALDSIAILVKDRYQALEIQNVLKKNNIPSHTQQSRKIYESPVFFCISELFQACFNPSNLSLLKVCLGNELFQVDPEVLINLEQHPSLPELINFFINLQQTLKSDGVAAFLSQLNRTTCPITNSTIEKGLLSLPDKISLYEDFITLQKSLLEFEGQTIGSFNNHEDLLFSFYRFLKDEELSRSSTKVEKSGSVNILTLHMSKGLEFDYVFPIGITKRHKGQPLSFYLNHPNYRVKKAALDNDPSLQLFHEEQNAEKIRQLYVALTRAKKHLYLPVFLHPKLKKAKLKELSLIEVYLHSVFFPENLHSVDKQITLELDSKTLDSCFSKHFSTELISIEKIEHCDFFNQDDNSTEIESSNSHIPKQLDLIKNTPTLSYSSIKRAQKLNTRYPEEAGAPPSPPSCKSDLLSQIPAGTETGIILHKILEKTSFKNLTQLSTDEIYEKLVKVHIEFSNCAQYAEAITYLLELLKQQSFQSTYSTFKLGEVDEKLILREAEFLFFEHKPDCFIHGFYDLCFEHKGYYYLLDWKSDRLERSSSYKDSNLRTHILNNYSLQIALYSRAIELFCQSNNTSTKFGGIFYVYLRGLSHDEGISYFSPEEISQIPNYHEHIKEAVNANT